MIREILRDERLNVLYIGSAISTEEVLDNLQLGSGSVKTAHFECVGFSSWGDSECGRGFRVLCGDLLKDNPSHVQISIPTLLGFNVCQIWHN